MAQECLPRLPVKCVFTIQRCYGGIHNGYPAAAAPSSLLGFRPIRTHVDELRHDVTADLQYGA